MKERIRINVFHSFGLSKKYFILHAVLTLMIDTPIKEVDVDFSEEVQSLHSCEAQVIVHCKIFADNIGDRFRIWPATFLQDEMTHAKSKLVHAVNVPYYPMWKIAGHTGWHTFTLVFEALPKTCTTFTLIEEIPEPGAFVVSGIFRNISDIYNIEL